MNTDRTTASKALAAELDALGSERGGKVVCLVLITSQHLELVWPGQTDRETMQLVVRAIRDSLAEDDGDEP